VSRAEAPHIPRFILRRMSYTIKNLKQVEDSAPKFGVGESQEARFATEDVDAETTGFSYHVLRPGKRQAFGHRHEEAEEVYVVLSGSGRLKLDDEIIEVGPMDAIRVAPNVARAFEAGPEGLETLAFGPRYKGDGEILRDFWPA
jgi:mannose-6-phosphate isomerase-like protein (cupin superfamily)